VINLDLNCIYFWRHRAGWWGQKKIG
jgi:hypothetical protein